MNGSAEIAVFKLPDGTEMSLHYDIHEANDTIRRLRRAETEYVMHVALAHDTEWIRRGKDEVLMSLLSAQKKGDWLARVRTGERP